MIPAYIFEGDDLAWLSVADGEGCICFTGASAKDGERNTKPVARPGPDADEVAGYLNFWWLVDKNWQPKHTLPPRAHPLIGCVRIGLGNTTNSLSKIPNSLEIPADSVCSA